VPSTSWSMALPMYARQVADLDGVLEHVLSVAGAVLHAAQELDELRMDRVQVGFKHRLLAGLADLVLHLAAGLLHDLLDAGGVDAAVGDELLQRHPGDLAAHRVETGDDDRLGRVVDDEVDAGGGFEGADVAALAADDAALHVVVGQRHHRYRGLRHVVGGALLDGEGDEVAGLLVGLLLRLGLDFAHHDGGVVVCILADAVHQLFPGLFEGHVGYALKFLLLLRVQRLCRGFQPLGLLKLLVEALLPGFQVVQLLVQGLFALGHPALQPGHFAAAVAHFPVQLILQSNNLFLGFENGFLLFLLSLSRGVVQQVLGERFGSSDLLFNYVLSI